MIERVGFTTPPFPALQHHTTLLISLSHTLPPTHSLPRSLSTPFSLALIRSLPQTLFHTLSPSHTLSHSFSPSHILPHIFPRAHTLLHTLSLTDTLFHSVSPSHTSLSFFLSPTHSVSRTRCFFFFLLLCVSLSSLGYKKSMGLTHEPCSNPGAAPPGDRAGRLHCAALCVHQHAPRLRSRRKSQPLNTKSYSLNPEPRTLNSEP